MKSVFKNFLLIGAIVISSLTFSGCASNSGQINQLDKPKSGEQIAIMQTSMGEIKMRFFPQVAPKAVENFVTHSKNGYYDNLTFHRIMKGFMIQGGDPKGTGMGGESIWGTPFNDEFSTQALNIRGSVAMANSGPNTNGSQFFINQAKKEEFAGWDKYKQSIDMSKVTDKIKNLYIENGGNPFLDGALSLSSKGHTVFAQVFEGLDIVDKIAAVETNASNKPKDAVTITHIEVTTYK